MGTSISEGISCGDNVSLWLGTVSSGISSVCVDTDVISTEWATDSDTVWVSKAGGPSTVWQEVDFISIVTVIVAVSFISGISKCVSSTTWPASIYTGTSFCSSSTAEILGDGGGEY